MEFLFILAAAMQQTAAGDPDLFTQIKDLLTRLESLIAAATIFAASVAACFRSVRKKVSDGVRKVTHKGGGTAAVLLLAIVLTGCTATGMREALFGPAETPEQRAFRVAAVYNYVAIPAVEYTSLPSAEPELVQTVCRLDNAVYASMVAAGDALRQNADVTTATLQAASAALASYAFELVGDFRNPASAAVEHASRTVYLAAVGTTALAKMRLYRQSVIEPKMESLVALNAEPSPEDWDLIKIRANTLHSSIQEKCSPPVLEPPTE